MVMPLSPSLRVLLPPLPAWGHGSSSCLFIFFPSKERFLNGFVSCAIPSSDGDDSSSKPLHSQMGYDPSEELLGLDVDLPSRNAISGAPRPRSWFGPNGQYIRELPCPSCRGRGYTPCTECGIERSRMDCSQCSGKGIVTCQRCSGECVIWEESIDERPWEKARSISPFKMKEDDEVDNLDIKLDVKKRSKRVYQSSAEVSLKISRSLKSLNAKTGLFSKRMKMIHQNPILHAQRVAAIKRAKGTPAARKRASETQKAFFSDPENRSKRSIAMKGVQFCCAYCGREGHRRHYCPELKDSLIDRRFRCRICGEKGHNRRTCRRLGLVRMKERVARFHCCTVCGRHGHNRRTCPEKIGERLLANPGPYAWVKYVPGEPILPNQPNEGSVKRRNEKKRMRLRRAFILAEAKKRKAQMQEAKRRKNNERVERKMAAVARERAWAQRLAELQRLEEEKKKSVA